MSASPRVSVFIPTYNGGPLFERVLDRLFAQRVDFEFEVVCIDSGSTDGTLEVLRRHPVRLTEIPNSEFNHGLTRNRGAHEARGEILVLTVQDAVPHGDDWLATLVSNFDDPEVAGAYCHQIPHQGCGPFLRDRLRSWVKGEGEPIVKQIHSPMEFWLLEPLDRWRLIAFDNVCSAVRRDLVTRELPFVRRQFGEDITWARSAVLGGYKVVMDPRCAVEHSHDNSIWYEFRRAYLDHANIHSLTGLQLAPDLHRVMEYSANLSRHLYRVLREDPGLSPLRRALWTAKIPWFAFSQNLAQWLGGLASRAHKRGSWALFDRIMRRRI
ncbi:MAG: glycosyltransferase family 2 protein [Planctomycetes bacterium]|nr:glycosyltransferase family 2 protein [Planctomycetota bacterium]